MVNVLSDSLANLADVGRAAAQRTRSSLSAQRARNFERISRGRRGIARPINFQPTGLSSRARNNIRNLQSGAAALGNLLTQTTFAAQDIQTEISISLGLQAFQDRLDANRQLAAGTSDQAFNTVI